MKMIKAWMIGCLAAAGLAGCSAVDDVAFARRVMTQLIEGRYAARVNIDWPRLMVLGQSIGREYASLPNDRERTDYERAFIDSFKKGYRRQKATVRSLVNWRLYNNADASLVLVAADSRQASRTLVFSVAKDKGKRKLVEIAAFDVNDPALWKKHEQEQRHVLPEKKPS